ncbi:MAG: hypothetical protein AAF092_14865 [Pseudomonadota bacterium]
MRRRAFLIGAPALLAACSTKPRVFASAERVLAVRAPNTGQTGLAVFTSFNVGSNNGAHTALFIHADEHVIFDAAGSFAHPSLPEQHDVIFGANDRVRTTFVRYHTRSTYWTTLQSFDVSPETARWVFDAARQAGPVPDAFCTRSISTILHEAPDMPVQIRPSWFPNALHDQLLDAPGVTREEFREDDDADKERHWDTNPL